MSDRVPHPNQQKAADCNPRLRKAGAIQEPSGWGPRVRYELLLDEADYQWLCSESRRLSKEAGEEVHIAKLLRSYIRDIRNGVLRKRVG